MRKRPQSYEPLRPERDSISAQPAPGARKEVPANVVTRHGGEVPSANDGERALDISMGRRSFRRETTSKNTDPGGHENEAA
jgi:hypothetical protein